MPGISHESTTTQPSEQTLPSAHRSFLRHPPPPPPLTPPSPAALRQIQRAGRHHPHGGDLPPALHKMEEPPANRNPAASLTDELLIEILRRLPIRSVCRFKCVSRSWRELISDPAHRKKLPHTLTGFFYASLSGERFPVKARHFTNVTGKGVPFIFPSFSLPVPSNDVVILDSCNGLLLCRCFEPGPHKGDGLPPLPVPSVEITLAHRSQKIAESDYI